MPVIRVPESCSELLQFVKGSPTERSGFAVFPTYAHLVATAAGLAAARGVVCEEPRLKEEGPRPIDFAVFRNQGLHYPLMAFALAHQQDPQVCSDVEGLCKIIECLSDAGCKELRDLFLEHGAQYWPGEWERILMQVLASGLER